MRIFVQTVKALTGKEISDLYALAERMNVGFGMTGGSGSPSKGPAEWTVSGGLRAIRRFVRETGVTPIKEPKYPKVRWTDAARWERKGRDY